MNDRRDLLRLTGVLVALLVATGAIILATGGGSDSEESGTSGLQTVDGIVQSVDATQLTLQPEGGGAPIRFAIRAVDQPTFDVFHLQEHAADGLLTRVSYIEDGSVKYATRADDAPESTPAPSG